ncbi:tyrosine 2,3-aminomutase [Myceligenerans indicum]|uniref:Tyrosine 2,3-aminomutase n=1 Tax=Myceligenerans indicum TaxID=2593663 RepID=A0ABS1LHJ4_9MICO|nr:tyrosine 2,3-aminomutase [Myceligenerans indicum]MBL0885608.1 tyrosine 2,3-aminomutase [Myceligenerans indicum]
MHSVLATGHTARAGCGPDVPACSHLDLWSAFTAVARERPGAVAVTDAQGSHTYRELHEAALARAAALRSPVAQAGANPCVVSQLDNGADHVALTLGSWRAGAMVAALGPGEPGTALRAELARVGPAVTVVAGSPRGPHRGDGAVPPVPAALVLGADDAAAPRAGDARPAAGDLAAPASLCFTSGTSGAPKTIVHSHHALAQLARWMIGEMRVGPGDRVAQWAAPGYDAAVVELLVALLSGATAHIPDPGTRGDPEALLGWLSDRSITWFQTVPSYLRQLVRAAGDGELTGLGTVVLAGERIPPALVPRIRRAAPGAELYNLYGPSETILATWYRVPDGHDGEVPIGTAIPGRRLRLAPDSGAGSGAVSGAGPDDRPDDRPDGRPDAVQLAIATPFAGTDLTGAPWTSDDGLVHTGDLVRRAGGDLYFAGRADDQVKAAGRRTELGGIEAVIEEAPGVRAACVLPVRDDSGLVTRLLAFVVHDAGSPTAADLRARCRARLGTGLPPIQFVRRDTLPRSRGGKVDTMSLLQGRDALASPAVTATPEVRLDGHSLTPEEVSRVAHEDVACRVPAEVTEVLERRRREFEDRIASGEPVYGVTTGYGEMIYMHVDPAQERNLQHNLVRSHTAGCGPHFSEPEARAIMLARANALAKGHSAVRPAVLERLVTYLERHVTPAIPEFGSLGASGDLAPLSHVASALIGEGHVLDDGRVRPTREVLVERGIDPDFDLRYKEGLALINGTSAMTGVGSILLHRARTQVWHAEIIAALAIEALEGSTGAFEAPGHEIARPPPGQIASARTMRNLLHGSGAAVSHESLRREAADSRDFSGGSVSRTGVYLQKAYSLRAVPQVVGAVRDTLANAYRTLGIELNSANDNPLVFDDEEIFHGANFHGQPVAFAMDFTGLSLTQLGVLSERRTNRLLNRNLSGLPEFLVAGDPGLNSGLAGTQYAATALVAENRTIGTASTQSVPSNGDNQDVVSMGLIAARNCRRIMDNTDYILAVEAISAAQAVDLGGTRERLGTAGRAAYEAIRERSPFIDRDRVMSGDVEAVRDLLRGGELATAVSGAGVELEEVAP